MLETLSAAQAEALDNQLETDHPLSTAPILVDDGGAMLARRRRWRLLRQYVQVQTEIDDALMGISLAEYAGDHLGAREIIIYYQGLLNRRTQLARELRVPALGMAHGVARGPHLVDVHA